MREQGWSYIINSYLLFIKKVFLQEDAGKKPKATQTKLGKYPYAVRGKAMRLVCHI